MRKERKANENADPLDLAFTYLFYFVITTQKCSYTVFEHAKILLLEFFSSPFWYYISMVILINFIYLSFGTDAALSMHHVLVFPNLILLYCFLSFSYIAGFSSSSMMVYIFQNFTRTSKDPPKGDTCLNGQKAFPINYNDYGVG